MTLDDGLLRTDLEVLAVTVPGGAAVRMAEIGLRVGARVQVVHRAPFGGRVIALGSARLAIDRLTATQVDVRVAS